MDLQRARIRGLLAGTTAPVSLSKLASQHKLEKDLLVTTVEELKNEGRLPGTLSGASKERATYTPAIYLKGQQSAVNTFFKQNGYVSYDRLKQVTDSTVSEW